MVSERLFNAMKDAKRWFGYVASGRAPPDSATVDHSDYDQMIKAWAADACVLPKTTFRLALDELRAALEEHDHGRN